MSPEATRGDRPFGSVPSRSPTAARATFALALLLAAALPWWAPGLLHQWDEAASDWFAGLGAQSPVAAIQLVDIDERSLVELGPWPWPRERVAVLMTKLRALGAERQIWDIVFAETKPGDDRLAAALGPDVVLGHIPVIDPDVRDPPAVGATPGVLAALADLCADLPQAFGHLGVAPGLPAQRVGHLAPRFDADGRLRRVPALVCVDGQVIPSLTLAPWLDDTARLRRGSGPLEPAWWLDTSRGPLPLDAAFDLRIPYRVPLAELQALPAAPMIDGAIPEGALKGKQVLIGSTALGSGDRVATPLSPVTPGLAVHAQILNALLSPEVAFVAEPRAHRVLQAAFILALAGIALPLARIGRMHAHLWAPILAALILAPLVHLALRGAGLWWGPVLPVIGVILLGLAGVLYTLRAQQSARQHLEAHLRSMLPPELAARLAHTLPTDRVLAQGDQYVVLYAALRNFDGYSARTEPERAIVLLHGLIQIAQPVVEHHGGALYPAPAGDLLAAWRAPHRAGARAAIDAAVALHEAVQPLLAAVDPLAPTQAPLALAIGLTAGPALSGFIGSRRHRTPLLFGPALDEARQLQAMTAELAQPVLIGEPLAKRADREAELRSLGRFVLPDRAQAQRLYVPDPSPRDPETYAAA